MTDRILLLLGITLMYSTPMVFAAQGSVISEVSGVVNIGIEGMMTVGAFTGATVGYYTGSPWLGFICAGLAGAFFGLIHAFASVTCKSDQTVCGIAMNLVGPGVALFLCRLFFDGATQSLPVTYKMRRALRQPEQPQCRCDHADRADPFHLHDDPLLQDQLGHAPARSR